FSLRSSPAGCLGPARRNGFFFDEEMRAPGSTDSTRELLDDEGIDEAAAPAMPIAGPGATRGAITAILGSKLVLGGSGRRGAADNLQGNMGRAGYALKRERLCSGDPVHQPAWLFLEHPIHARDVLHSTHAHASACRCTTYTGWVRRPPDG